MADPLTLTEEQLMGRKKDWLIAACDKLSIQCNRGATKSVLANAIVAFGAAQKAKKKTVSVVTAVAATPARVAAAIPNIFQRDRTSPISPPAQINGPPPAAVRLDAASTPRLAATRAVPSTVAVANRRGRSPARTNRERSASVGRGAAPAVLPQQLAAPPPVNVPRVVAVDANNNDDENDEFVEDRSPSPAPRRVSATRGVSPARVSREPRASFVGGDRVAASERAAHRRWIAQIVAVAVVVLGLIAWFVLGTPTPPGEVAASEALQRLREAHGAFLCDPQAPYQFTAQQLFGNLAPEDRQRAEAMLAASSEAVDTAVDAQSKHTLFSAKAAFAAPTLGCRVSLFTRENWPALLAVGVVVAAALALWLRAQQASWRQRRVQELVKEVFTTLKAQAAAYERDDTKQAFIAAVHLRDTLLPHERDEKLWDDVLALVQRNTCVKTSGRLVGGAQCDVLEWVAPLVVDHVREEFRSPPRSATPNPAPPVSSSYSPFASLSRPATSASYPIL